MQGPAVVPHPALIRRYEQKVASLREALNDELIRAEASQSLRSLIGSVTVHVDENGAQTLEVEASTSTLIDFATSTNAPGG